MRNKTSDLQSAVTLLIQHFILPDDKMLFPSLGYLRKSSSGAQFLIVLALREGYFLFLSAHENGSMRLAASV